MSDTVHHPRHELPIALDAMGGDHMPAAAADGALRAVAAGARVVLVGDRPRLEAMLRERGGELPIEHAGDVIGMDDHASDVRRRKEASVVVATRLVKEGRASAVVSMGHSGATMAAALLFLGRLPGVDRPAILANVPTLEGFCALIDAGANADCRPTWLQQFAIMGSVYARAFYGRAEPTVGLMSIGEEEGKGNELTLARHVLSELGESGWTLLGGSDPRIESLRSVVDQSSDGLVVKLLGTSSTLLDSIEVPLIDRQLDLLAVLLSGARGRSLQEVAVKIYGDRAVIGTTKALISRLRSSIPLESRPYRLTVKYQADFLDLIEHLRRGRVRQALNLYRGPLLPKSEAPAVVELREHIDESLRQAVLGSGDAEAMIELANRTDASDLELLETALDHLSQNDPQSPLLRARIRQIRRQWNADAGGGRRSGP